VLLKNEVNKKFSKDHFSGPFKIIKVHKNGSVRLDMGNWEKTYNIQLLKPYRKGDDVPVQEARKRSSKSAPDARQPAPRKRRPNISNDDKED
jgi:hypothetical protein